MSHFSNFYSFFIKKSNTNFNIELINVQVRSTSNPKGSRDQKSSPLFNPSNFWINGKGCPDGMVPIKRNTVDDLKRAKLATEIHNSKYKPLTIDRPGTHVSHHCYTNLFLFISYICICFVL